MSIERAVKAWHTEHRFYDWKGHKEPREDIDWASRSDGGNIPDNVLSHELNLFLLLQAVDRFRFVYIARICPNSGSLVYSATQSVILSNVSWFYPRTYHTLQERGYRSRRVRDLD